MIGYDVRQPVSYQVLSHSILSRAKRPVSIMPLMIDTLPILRQGLTPFTFTRYLVPWLCDYEGEAIFMDSDMLCLTDITTIPRNDTAVSVVKNNLRFEWPSLMVFNCEQCKDLTPEYIETGEPQSLEWAGRIGSLPSAWNHLVGYDPPQDAKIVHYTQGIPCFPEVDKCEYAQEWMKEIKIVNSAVPWAVLMGDSVHAQPVLERIQRETKASQHSQPAEAAS
jgi:hypothetical protein